MGIELSAGELLHHFRDYLRHCVALMATAVLVLLSCALKGEGGGVVTFACHIAQVRHGIDTYIS